MHERNYTKLWWRNCLAIICLSVVPLLFVAISLYSLFDGIYTEKVTETLKRTAENRRDAIDLFFNERIAQLYTIANTNTFAALSDETFLKKIFEVMHVKSNSYMDIGVIDDEGNHRSYVGPYYSLLKEVNYKHEPWFNATKANGIYISDIFMGFRKVPHFIIAVMVREKNTSWILRVTINLKNIYDVLQVDLVGEGSDAFIVNNKNVLMTQPRSGGYYLEKPNYPDFSSTITTNAGRRNFEAQESFYASTKISSTKWVLVVKEDPAEILLPFQKGRYLMVFFTISGLATIVLGAIIFTNVLINRIRQTDQEDASKSDMLIQANKMIALSKMAAGIAHEVNNPLAAIAEVAGWMKDLLAEEDIAKNKNFTELDESVDKIEQQVARAKKVIHNLLGFARRMEPAKEKINVNTLLDETTGFLDNEAKYVNINIEKKYAENVPIITNDLSQIQQVILNILNNAIDAIEHSGTVTVSTRYHEKTDEVEISIADTGKGIPESNLGKIFDPFFTTKEVGKGTGLGLSISYTIIEKLGGRITVESKAGEGTVFTIFLPKN
ncbi:MAG: ATP-binding protein [Proteobacteria bacterium]|nr:ATP-binding protein [Pseudomonadota bacterium]